MQIKPAVANDMQDILALGHDYQTEHVWQMELEPEGHSYGARFRPTRLPRPMKVSYPKDIQWMADHWKQFAAFLIAEEQGRLFGYITITDHIHPNAAWISDWAVAIAKRRQGIGTQLILAAQKWAIKKSFAKISVEMQSKNMPAIRLVQKMGFEYSGFHDRYYENQDIAIFFTKRLV